MKTSKKILKLLDRLKKRSDFLYVQGQGKKWVAKGLVLQAAPNHTESIRVGFTVTKKVSKKAVVRNRIKRRLRAVAADIIPVCAVKGYDYILVGRYETLEKDYLSLQKDLQWCLKRLDLSIENSARSQDLSQGQGEAPLS